MAILIHNCRLCQINTGSIPLQEKLCELILKITNIKINETSELPSTICIKCNNKIREIDQFIRDIQKTNNHLQMCIKKYDDPTDVLFRKSYFQKYSAKTEFDLNEVSVKQEHPNDKREEKQSNDINYESNCSRKSVDQKENIISEINTSMNSEENEEKAKYQCIMCGKVFEDEHEYTSHLGTHDQFICKVNNCLKIYNSLRSFKEHQRSHGGKRPFLCVICGKDFASKKCLICHEKTHALIKGYKCESCNLDFSVRSNLRTHIKKHHEYNRFYCSQCPKEFMSKCSLDRHEKIHIGIKEFKCEDCSAAFYTKKELLKHQKYHQGVKLHKCEICFKTFFERHHLTTHIRSHNGERPFVCGSPNCGKSFYDKQKLKRHQKSVHISKEIKIKRQDII
ncbi:zinc finger protein OZF-like [Diorhabda carinulata]|uniref:zinc finger protein OZF-like n=1 Tax=Diorhabda carinulata TaxID=1163345 RepID=UPI0025A039EA|nr:zinc finger protein OZF-like [Diorhabda carinulata]